MMSASEAALLKKLILYISDIAGTDKTLDPEMRGVFELFKKVYPDLYTDVLRFLESFHQITRTTQLSAIYNKIQTQDSFDRLERKYGKELINVLIAIADQIVS